MHISASWSGFTRPTEYKFAGANSLAAMRTAFDTVIPATSSLVLGAEQQQGTNLPDTISMPSCSPI